MTCNQTSVTPEQFVARAAELRPMIAEVAEQAEEARQVPVEIIDEVRSQGFFRMVQPRRFGGFEYDCEAVMRCVVEWSSADASIGWVCSLGVVHQWLIAQFPMDAQEEMWSEDPSAIACGSYAPAGECVAVEGGYRISGKFRFASGVDVMGWAVLGVFFPSEDGSRMPGFALLPKSDFEIEDDWHVMGLCGTGSKTIVCENTFVPAHRRVTFVEIVSGNAPGYQALRKNLYRYPILSFIAHGISTPALGCLNGALDTFVKSMAERETRGAIVLGGNKVGEFQAVQMRVGKAAACLRAARAMLFEQLAASREKVIEQGELLSVADRLDNRITQAAVVKLSVEGVDHLFGAVGGQGIQADQHIQRAWRDVHAIAHHISFNWDALTTMYGQHLLGMEPQGQF